MQCGVEERTIRNTRVIVVKCFKCGKEGYKYRWYLLWKKIERKPAYLERGKAQEKKPAHPVKGKVQKEERRLRRVEGSKVVCPTKGKA